MAAFFDPYTASGYYDYKMTMAESNITSMFSNPYSNPFSAMPFQSTGYTSSCFEPYSRPLPVYCYQPTPTTSIQPIPPIPPPVISAISTPSEERAESEDGATTTTNGSSVSISCDKRSPGAKRGRPTKNPVWTLFTRLNDKNARCNKCMRLVKSACATNMTKHIERHHSDSTFILNSHSYNAHTALSSDDPHGEDPHPPSSRVPKRFRRTKHPVWDLFLRTSDGTAQCVLCGCVVRSPCSSNFMGHLNRHHLDHYQAVYNHWLGRKLQQYESQAVANLSGVLPKTELPVIEM